LGLAGSALTLQTDESVSIHLRPEKIYEIVKDYS
jgi:pseudouridine kinase